MLYNYFKIGKFVYFSGRFSAQKMGGVPFSSFSAESTVIQPRNKFPAS